MFPGWEGFGNSMEIFCESYLQTIVGEKGGGALRGWFSDGFATVLRLVEDILATFNDMFGDVGEKRMDVLWEVVWEAFGTCI